MRPTTPNLRVSQSVGPSSPPETPTTSSPVLPRPKPEKGTPGNPKAGRLPVPRARPMATPEPGPYIRPVGNGPSFSFSRPIRPEELSPQSLDSSAASVSDKSDESSTGSPPPPRSITSNPPTPLTRTTRVVTQASFVVEELSDFGGSADETHAEIIRPHAIEYADSDRSRSRSRGRRDGGLGVDPKMVHNFRNLNCSDDSEGSDDIDMDDMEYQRFLMKRREDKRRRRMTSGSIGKRTISESIGSDSDREDMLPFLEVNEVGSSARRLRRRVGDRRSLQFQDPPPPRIEELEEPPTTDDELSDGESLARELPYYTLEYISMEIDSP